MDEHVGIAVAKETEAVVNLYAAKPKVTTFNKLVNVVTKADSKPTPNPSQREGGLVSSITVFQGI